MTIELPNKQTKIWAQTGRGTTLASDPAKGLAQPSLTGSFNLDLQTNLGKVRGTRMIQTTTQATNTDLTAPPVKFVAFQSQLWTVAGTKVHTASTATQAPGGDYTRTPFIVDTRTNSPTACSFRCSDMEIFNSYIYVTSEEVSSFGKLWKNDGATGTWTSNAVTLNSPTFHCLAVYANRLYVGYSQTTIYSINTADTMATSGQYTINLQGDNSLAGITFMKPASDRIWIGWSEARTGRKGYMYDWDGSSNQVTKSYKLESAGPVACVIKEDVPYIMDSNGRLLVFNGGAFTEIARLPLRDKNLYPANFIGANNYIHPNGMTLINGKINILVQCKTADDKLIENCPSGIWEYDPLIGLYHKHSLSYTPVGTTTVTDWGQTRMAQPGALTELKLNDSAATANGGFLAGAQIYTTATATDCGIFTNDTLDTTQKFSHFITPELPAEGITDTFNKAYVVYRKLLSATDKIIVKYRTSKQDATEMTITWTSTTTFTTTDSNMANYAVGDEVEITRGKGGGMCSHITVISLAAGTYTVTVDETHTGATSGTASARFQKWIKAGYISDQVRTFKDFPVEVDASWIQYKVCLLGTGANEIERFVSVSKPKQSAV